MTADPESCGSNFAMSWDVRDPNVKVREPHKDPEESQFGAPVGMYSLRYKPENLRLYLTGFAKPGAAVGVVGGPSATGESETGNPDPDPDHKDYIAEVYSFYSKYSLNWFLAGREFAVGGDVLHQDRGGNNTEEGEKNLVTQMIYQWFGAARDVHLLATGHLKKTFREKRTDVIIRDG